MRYFGVININDKNAQTFIDGIRLLCASKIKHKAHITLIGPKDSEEQIKFQKIRRNEQIVYINGIGNFFSEGQNTVYLKCDLDEGSQIKSMIDKPDYGNETPHITLYDGDNRTFAENLYNLAKSYNDKIKFQIIVSKDYDEYAIKKEEFDLNIIESKKDYLSFNSTFYNHLSYYLGWRKINKTIIENLSDTQRLEYVENLFSLFKNWQNHKVIANPCISVISELNLTEENGLFFYDDIKKWKNFPTNIKQAIHQAKPYAFFTLQEVDNTKRFDTELPFVFIYSNPTEADEIEIRKKVFNFGNAPIVILHRKEVKIFNGLLYNRDKEDNLLINKKISEFSYDKMLTQSFWDEHLTSKRHKDIHHYFLSNIKETRDYLKNNGNLSSIVCNRLIGRLLFIRYFIDRKIQFKKEDGSYFFDNDKEKFADIIKDKVALYSFFKYFKEKYNGDLFPVTEEEINSITTEHLTVLSILFRGGEFSLQNKKLYIQESLFDVYDFSIIPIELVSSVYESFMGEKQPNSIKVQNKAFYTPFFLADFVLENTLGKYIRNTKDIDFVCPVLDPSCGSGIFLVEALRKIIEQKIDIKTDTLNRQELWDCVLKNIFGIDIDEEAIDIAIFSIYVTVLDYISPAEISKDFKFENLKGANFFNADFFDRDNKFNQIFSSNLDSDKINFEKDSLEKIGLKFIIGNPPWGQIKDSLKNPKYVTYCANRGKEEKRNIGISDKQIAQAFLVRVSDISTENTEYAFVVTSKILYNTNANIWRNYFFNRFSVSEIYDFSPVRASLFKDAAWPTIVIFYSGKSNKKFEYFSINSKEFSKRFNSFSVTQQSIKEFSQNEIQQLNKHYNWFWKTMLYGSFFDFLIIKKLKEQFRTIFDYIDQYGLQYGVGLKRVDGKKKPDASNLIGYKFIDTQKKELQQFAYKSSSSWQEETAGNIPQKDVDDFPVLFTPPLALIKEGLTPSIKGVAAFCSEKVIFTHSVRAIKGRKKDTDILKSIVGLINSDLFSYYILHTGSSVGIDLTRANQIEQFSFPAILSKEIAKLVDCISNIDVALFSYNQERNNLINTLNQKIFDLYNLTQIEKDFINYTINYVSKTLKHADRKRINQAKELDGYKNVFLTYFEKQNLFFNISYCIEKDFVGIFFEQNQQNKITYSVVDSSDIQKILHLYGNLSIEQISKQIFLQKNVIEISSDETAYCIIKINNAENWQSANAWLELVVFLKDMISSSKGLYSIYEDLYKNQTTITE
jgi:hypothetical protein